MGLFKKHTPFGESIYVWCLGLWMATQTSDPVIEVVYGDQEDIGFSFWAGSLARLRERKR